MKETFYFSHDYNASQDPKILNLLYDMKWEGYGLYWMLIEKLAEANGKLLLNDVRGIAFSSQVELEKLTKIISCYDLFCEDEKYFWSNRLLEHLNNRQKISKLRSKLGKKGGQATAKQLLSKSLSKINQSKVKESKGKEIINTLSNDSLVYGNNYKPDHNPPKRKNKILTDKQKIAVKRMQALSYFHDKGVENGFDYLLEEDDQANRKFIGLARAFETRYPDNWKEVIDWWFESENTWCDYRPNVFFSIDTYMKFENRNNKKDNYIIL